MIFSVAILIWHSRYFLLMPTNKKSKKELPETQGEELSYKYIRSPDKNYFIRIGSTYEYTYGITSAVTFHLLDKHKEVIFDFRPLAAEAKDCKWSKDSRYIVAAARCNDFNGVCVIDLQKKKFGLVNFKNSPQIEVKLVDSTKVCVRADSDQLKARNNTATFGAGPAEFPCIRYRGEQPVILDINDLVYKKLENISHAASLFSKAKTHTVRIIKDGFHPFKGLLPQSTTQKFNTRQMEVFHLELFAAYGDKVSAKWLKEVKQLSKGKYSPWDHVSNYLGKRKRPAGE